MPLPTKLEKAKSILVLDHPFFASLLLKYDMVERKDMQSILAIDAHGQIYYNAKRCEELSVPQLVWGLSHEVLHKVGMHATRRGNRDPKKWNEACDGWVNDTLNDAKVGETIPDTVNMPGSRDKTVDEIYNYLMEQQQQPNGGGGKGQGEGNGDGDGSGDPMGDDLIDSEGDDVSEEEMRQMETQMKIDVAQAANAAKMKGKLPGALERFADEFINVKTPWYDLLERFMTSKIKIDQSWKRPNRRFMHAGLYLPVIDSIGTMGEVVIGVDTSGSVGQEELNEFSGHVNRILEQCNPKKAYVVYCDSEVVHVDEFTPEEFPIKLKPHGGGGTDMREIVNWTKKHADEAECLIILTDNYTPFPTEEVVPTIWASTTSVAAPKEAGETVFISDR
jgi:predicted metal-dependent peptidase